MGWHELNGYAQNRSDAPPAAQTTTSLDGTKELPADDPKTVRSMNLAPGSYFITAHVTVSGTNSDNNVVCSLIGDDGHLAEANEKVSADGQQNASMTLTGIGTPAEETGKVYLNCRSGNGATATDISLTAVEVTTE